MINRYPSLVASDSLGRANGKPSAPPAPGPLPCAPRAIVDADIRIRAMTAERRPFTRVLSHFHENEDRFASVGRWNAPFARLAIFVIYFWFGILKMIGVSAAGPLVSAMWAKTVPFIPLPTFMILFSAYEMLIGILFLIPRMERHAIGLVLLHIFTTAMPLVLLPGAVWQVAMVPTMEGQYIIKNLAIVALALSIGTSMHSGVASKNE